jgi:hypothetical protein
MKLHEKHGDLGVLAVPKTFVTLVPLRSPSNRKDTVGFFEAVTIRQILDTEGVMRRGGART